MRPPKRIPHDILFIFDLFPPLPPSQWRNYIDSDERECERDVLRGLESLGHHVQLLGLSDSLEPFLTLVKKEPPQLIFNLCEAIYDERAFEADLVSLFELFLLRYTGSKSTCLHICKDKALTKQIAKGMGVRTPRFQTVRRDEELPKHWKDLPFPRIVKPLSLEGSEGISARSLVRTEGATRERVEHLRKHWKCDGIIEEYVHGRELSVSVLGNAKKRVALPISELIQRKGSPMRPRITTLQAKWDDDYREKQGISTVQAMLTRSEEKQLKDAALLVAGSLGVSGYARIDFRLPKDGIPVFLEANPNPSLAESDEFAQSAKASGIEYEELLQKILELA